MWRSIRTTHGSGAGPAAATKRDNQSYSSNQQTGEFCGHAEGAGPALFPNTAEFKVAQALWAHKQQPQRRPARRHRGEPASAPQSGHACEKRVPLPHSRVAARTCRCLAAAAYWRLRHEPRLPAGALAAAPLPPRTMAAPAAAASSATVSRGRKGLALRGLSASASVCCCREGQGRASERQVGPGSSQWRAAMQPDSTACTAWHVGLLHLPACSKSTGSLHATLLRPHVVQTHAARLTSSAAGCACATGAGSAGAGSAGAGSATGAGSAAGSAD